MVPKHVVDLIKRSTDDSFFVYDLETMNRQMNRLSPLTEIDVDVCIFYAMKANPFHSVLECALAFPLISGIEIASGGEAGKVMRVLGNLKRCIYTGPGKTVDELRYSIKYETRLLNIESLVEAHRVNEILCLQNSSSGRSRKQAVLLRVNTDTEVHGTGKMCSASEPSAFGVDENDAVGITSEVMRMDNIRLQGFHMFGATGVIDYKDLLENVDYCLSLVKSIEKQVGNTFPVIDFGGGFGIDYGGERAFDVGGYSEGLKELISKHKMRGRTFILELGRYLTADMGYFVTKILDIKNSRYKKVIVTAAGINAHRRPYALHQEYRTSVIPMNAPDVYAGQPEVGREDVIVHGPLCTPADVLGKQVRIERARIGDYLVQEQAGAYGLTMSAVEFLSHPRIQEFAMGGKKNER